MCVMQHELDGDNIIYESCLEWFHYGCVGVVSNPSLRTGSAENVVLVCNTILLY